MTENPARKAAERIAARYSERDGFLLGQTSELIDTIEAEFGPLTQAVERHLAACISVDSSVLELKAALTKLAKLAGEESRKP